jgi:hypothetical protein
MGRGVFRLMGLYDESWCSGCGCSITYTADESAQCGDCVDIDFHEFREGNSRKINSLIQYIYIHLASLQQDYDKFPDGDRDSIIHLNGQVLATSHLLSVAKDILNDNHQGKGY